MIAIPRAAVAAATPPLAGPTLPVCAGPIAPRNARRAPRRRRPVAGAVVVACAALAVGCGDDGLPQRITSGQESDLHTLVDRGRTAAAAGDLAATQAALQRLDAEVRALRERGALGADRAKELLKISAVTKLKATRTLQPAAPAETVVAPPAQAAAPPAVAPAGKPPKGHGKTKRHKKGD